MALEKAKIEALDINGNPIPEKTFNVLFNPEEYTINKDINYAVQGIPGLSGPLIQFVNGNLRTLEMELFFDTWDTPDLTKLDVRNETNKIVNLMCIDPELHAPPHLNISWSSLQFRCVLARVSQKFIMFADSGTPVRARLTCTFNEDIDPEQEACQIKRQTVDFSKAHVVTQDDTLSGISAKYYNNPQLWRPIAMANQIADPRSIFNGQMLSIPPLPYIDPESREVVN
jgi:hypothetical protein